MLYSQSVELYIMVILRQGKQILKHGRVSLAWYNVAITTVYLGMIFEELGSFQQQVDLYKQKLGFESRQSGPITFQN